MTCSNYASSISCENLINKYMYNLLTRESRYLTFFLIQTAYFVIISLAIIFLTKSYFMVIVDSIILTLMAYIYGFDLCVVVLSLGLAGVIFGIVILGVLGILVFLGLILIISIATKRFLISKKMCDGAPPGYYSKLYVLLIVISVIIIFVLSLLFSIILIFVIVD